MNEMLFSILTGFGLGALHVVRGPDHLVAMAPNIFQKPRLALKNGLAWGLGHSAGVLLLSFAAMLVKDFVQIEWMSNLAELFVGIFLLIVGILTVKTSFGLRIHTHTHNHENGSKHQHVHLLLLDSFYQ